jgi:CheY-like chemotaxis protein
MTMPKPTILIVEDDPEIRRLVRDFLVHEGYDVETAEDAKAMDTVLQRLRPDLIILDLMLPGEDGLAICRRLRVSDPIPILMLTAKSDETIAWSASRWARTIISPNPSVRANCRPAPAPYAPDPAHAAAGAEPPLQL